MNVCVFGLWHLGSVTAACVARAGCRVVGLDENLEVIANLNLGQAPLMEPGLDELTWQRDSCRSVAFHYRCGGGGRDTSIVWIAFDTPVSEDDVADVSYVTTRVLKLLPLVAPGALIIVSSQLPVGSIRALEQQCGRQDISFACLPENLRLGKAIQVFNQPDRVIAGVRNQRDRETVADAAGSNY